MRSLTGVGGLGKNQELLLFLFKIKHDHTSKGCLLEYSKGIVPKTHPIWRSHPCLKALNTQNDKTFYLKCVLENLLQSICTKLCNLNAVTDILGQFYTL